MVMDGSMLLATLVIMRPFTVVAHVVESLTISPLLPRSGPVSFLYRTVKQVCRGVSA